MTIFSTPRPSKIFASLVLFMSFCAFVDFSHSSDFSTQEGSQDSSPFFLSTDDLLSVASLVSADLQTSNFAHSLDSKAIIAISDFNSLSNYPIDIEILARATLKDIIATSKLSLTSAISGNALSADKMLDSIRAMRNNSEFGDIIPKGSLLPPKYSLSTRISSETKAMPNINSVEYSFIFSIVNLQNGLVEWDYIERIKKSAKSPLPKSTNIVESKYGKACKKRPQMSA